jgi:hypothetical protein
MKERVEKLLLVHIAGNGQSIYKVSREIASDFKSFILWKDSPESGVITHYNGITKDRDRISYDLKDKNYMLDQLFEHWVNKVKE